MKMNKWLSVLLAAAVLVCAVPMLVTAEAAVLTVDTPLTVVPGPEIAEVTFTPTQTGLYEWTVSAADPSDAASPWLELVDASQEPVGCLTGGNDWQGSAESYGVYFLTADESYTAQVMDRNISVAGVVMTVKAVSATSSLVLNTPTTVAPKHYFSYVSFTPAETGDYVFSSAAVSDEGPDPCLRDVYDKNGEPVNILDGQSDDYDQWDFYAAFTLTAGETYTLILSDYSEINDGFAVTVAPYYGITKQPTAADPMVKVNRADEVSSYQWYTLKRTTIKVTEEQIGQNWGSTYEPASDTWSVGCYDDGSGVYFYSLFTLPLHAGDVLKITSSDTFDAEQCWVRTFDELIPEVEDGALVYTIPTAGEYGIDLATDGDSSTFAFEVTTGVLDQKIDGQTAATLTKYDKNASYACVVTFKNELTLTSDFVKMVPVIVKQPTAADPSVAASFEKDVKTYEWYTVKSGELITEDDVADLYENVTCVDGVWKNANPFFVSTNMWGYDLFDISLQAGDVVTFLCSDVMDPYMWYFSGHNMGMAELTQKGKMFVFTVSEDDVYSVGIATDGENSTFTVIDGEPALDQKVTDQTAKALTAYEDGVTYACVVTYTDGVVLTSDMFTATAETGVAIKQAKADEVAALINALPETLSKADADAVEAAKKAYDALSDDLKALISDAVKAKLNAAVAAIEALNQVVIVPENPADEPADIPPTGEQSIAWLWLVLAVMSGSLLCVVKKKAHA